MASSSHEQQQPAGDITPVARFINPLATVEWKANNYLPLVNLPKEKSYFQDARNLLMAEPIKKALTINVLANRDLLFDFWATALVIQEKTKKGNSMENGSRIHFPEE